MFDHKWSMRLRDLFTQENQNKIEMVQRRAACFACTTTDAKQLSVTSMLKLDELGWCSLKQQRQDQKLIMLYKIVNNLYS